VHIKKFLITFLHDKLRQQHQSEGSDFKSIYLAFPFPPLVIGFAIFVGFVVVPSWSRDRVFDCDLARL